MPRMYRFACTLRASAEARNPADCRQHSRAAGHYSIYGLDAPGSASTGQEGDAKGEDGDLDPGEANGVDDQGESGAPRRHLSAAEHKPLEKGVRRQLQLGTINYRGHWRNHQHSQLLSSVQADTHTPLLTSLAC